MEQSKVEQLQENINRVGEALVPLFENINNAFQVLADSLAAIVEPIAMDIQRMMSIMRLIRLPDESIVDYLDRNPHLIDNPDLRWEYQCYIWQTPLRLFRQWRHRK